MVRDRGFRRHQIAVQKARARRHITTFWMDIEPTPDQVGRRARTRQACSCQMCGHRRFWQGQTMQERRQAVV